MPRLERCRWRLRPLASPCCQWLSLERKATSEEEDLDVELILMTASVANMALIGGNVDFSSSGPSVVGAIARGAPLKFVFLCFNRPMHWLYARPEIKDAKGLKGKKIGVSAIGASAHFLFKRF
jgi:ABC-type nitrate/sulfonate/bicarbonate transport system substrate-binding protein